MLGAIGMGELALILIVAFVVVGPERMPDVARQLGKGVRAVKTQLRDLDQSLKDEVDDLKNVADLDSHLKDWQDLKKSGEEAKADLRRELDLLKEKEGGGPRER